MKRLSTFKRPARTTTVALASAAAGMALAVPGLAMATNSGQSVSAPPAVPTSASQIQNIDQVKTAIKGYYGDTPTSTVAPGTGGTTGVPAVTLHQFNPDGNYAHEVEGIASGAGKYIDDTTLNTYSYEIYSSFVFNPTSNAAFVNAGSASVFPAVPGMVGLEKRAMADGYQVFFLTGRPAAQLTGTLANLRDAGYTVDDSHVFLKDLTASYLQPCQTDANNLPCTTTEYKSLTRKHIEQDLGYDIVANFGDQFSDLNGGFADRTYKIPNPMYFLP